MTQQAKGFDRPTSLAQLVRRAVGIVDPDDEDGVVAGYYRTAGPLHFLVVLNSGCV